MRLPRHSRHLASLTSAFLLAAALPLHADERVVYYSQPTETPGFFQRVGEFFRDMFSTEQSLSLAPSPPRPTAPRYNLDLAPPGAGYSYSANHAHHSSASDSTEQTNTESYDRTPPAKSKPAKPHPAPTVASSEPTRKPAEKPKLEAAPKTKHTVPEYTESTSTSSESTRNTSITSKSSSESKSVPTGTRTGKSTRVKSPYPPYNELDVTGLPTGSLAMDPTTQKVFRVP